MTTMKRLINTTALAVLGLGTAACSSGTTVATTATRPVIVVWGENHSAKNIPQSQAPYLYSLKANYRYFDHYFGITHPSLPNYLAATSGSTHGITNDYVTPYSISGSNIFSQLENAGYTVDSYAEPIPQPCWTAGQNSHPYILHHTPSMFYSDLSGSPCETNDVNPSAPLADFTWVVPNENDNLSGPAITPGDTWMKNHIPGWINAGAIVIFTFDEGGDVLFTVEAGNGISHTTVSTSLNHYGLLAGLETYFGVPKLGQAQTANVLPVG